MGIDIRRNYKPGKEERTPEEKQKDLDEQMKNFLAKGGKVQKVKAHEPTKEQRKNWSI